MSRKDTFVEVPTVLLGLVRVMLSSDRVRIPADYAGGGKTHRTDWSAFHNGETIARASNKATVIDRARRALDKQARANARECLKCKAIIHRKDPTMCGVCGAEFATADAPRVTS
jgi:hypothetical protein